MEDRLLKQKEVCKMLGLADSTLEQWRLKGKGPKFKRLSARAIRYAMSDVQAYIQGLESCASTTQADMYAGR